MRSLRFGLSGGLVLAAAALLAGCAALQSSTSASGALPQSGNATPLRLQRDAALAVPHYVQRSVHPDHGSSWMLPQGTGGKSALIYVGDDSTNDVYVYDYKSGKSVGTLTGFDGPYGECVDAKGDVYIANFDAGNAVEYAHGGTETINTFDSGGTPIGCSVDSKGDVAVTSFDPGEVTVFAGGDPSKGTTYTGSCTYVWTMGYDSRGNLIGVGETSSGGRCYAGLLSGGKSMSSLSFSGTIDFPGGTMWDGKYIALGDQEADGTFDTGMIQATLSGSTLTSHGETILTCNGSAYTDAVNPFIVGKKNTPINDRQAKVVVDSCSEGGIGLWHYPKGGNPFKNIGIGDEPYGIAVSLGR
ncbi:MAG: hypothetical protein ABSD52_06230 [Candidatus Cybelea sp.]